MGDQHYRRGVTVISERDRDVWIRRVTKKELGVIARAMDC